MYHNDNTLFVSHLNNGKIIGVHNECVEISGIIVKLVFMKRHYLIAWYNRYQIVKLKNILSPILNSEKIRGPFYAPYYYALVIIIKSHVVLGRIVETQP